MHTKYRGAAAHVRMSSEERFMLRLSPLMAAWPREEPQWGGVGGSDEKRCHDPWCPFHFPFSPMT